MSTIKPLDFFEKYKLIGSVDLYESIKPKECRFCGQKSELYFKTDCHMIPELLGENDFCSEDECDNCNSFFSKYESHLAIFARPFLTLTNVKTKSKTPIFQSRTDFENQIRTTVRVDKTNNQRIVNANSKDILVNKENDLFELTLRNPGFKPILVYRALSKIMLSIMPIEVVKENLNYFEWILEKKEMYEVPHAFQTKLVTKYFPTPNAMLYQARNLTIGNIEYPEFSGVISFANTIIQFYLPISTKAELNHNSENRFDILIFPGFAYDGIPKENKIVNLTHMNLGQKDIYKHDVKFTFKPRGK